MDNGALTDHYGKKVDFRNVIIVMTTNAGASEAAKSAIGFGSSKRTGDDMEAINRLFAPEFRNRLDAIIPFAGLKPEIVHQVVQKFVIQLEAQLSERGVTFELTPEAVEWISKKGYDDRMGARPLGRVIQEYIKKPLADEVLFGNLQKGGTVKVTVEEKDGEKTLKLEAIEDKPVKPKKEKVVKKATAKKATAKKKAPAKASAKPKSAPKPKRKGGTAVPKVPLKN
jgi:ATP-dependent Clp protease ATP-binding subunit ClpA